MLIENELKNNSGYVPLRLCIGLNNKELTFDLYIYLNNQFIIYRKKGSYIDRSHLIKLKKQKIASFFIQASDELNYHNFLDEVLNEAANNSTFNLQEKICIVKSAGEAVVSKMQSNPDCRQAYKMTTNFAENLIKIMLSNPFAVRSLYDNAFTDSSLIAQHSLGVCAVSIKMATILKVRGKNLENIAISGLLHDIGLIKLKNYIDLFKKKRAEFKLKERREYDRHSELSVQVLKDKHYINSEIISLILNHEENLSGTGPNKKIKLTRDEEIISLANVYDKMICAYKYSSPDAIKQIMISEVGNYELKIIDALKRSI